MHYRIHAWQLIYGQQLLYESFVIFNISLVVFSRNDTVQHSLGMVVLFILYLEPSIKDSAVQLLKSDHFSNLFL